MIAKKLSLASDNYAPVHPSILKAIENANEGFAASYGADPWTIEATQLIQEAIGKQCKVYFIPTGTGSNVLALKISCRSHESIICSDIAHVNFQEAGAAESIVGCKLLTVPHQGGKVTPGALLKKLNYERFFGRHSTSPRVVTITQPTEFGTVYSMEELRSLSNLCRQENLLLHVDGSRFYNSAVALNVSLEKMIDTIQPDILSLGGTKNGLMGAEALLIFNPALEEGSHYLQKQTLQLLSKMRYCSAQYIPFFKNDLWKVLATQANDKAQEIASIILAIPQLTLNHPVETNQIFFTAPPSWIPLIQDKIHCYTWDQEKNEIRLIASWNTSEQDIKDLKAIFSEISHSHL